MRAELFFVAFFHYCTCSTLISPPVDFRNVPFRMTEMWIFVVKQVSVRVSYRQVAVMYVQRYCTQVVFPSGRCPVTSTCGQFDSRSIYGPLHTSLVDPFVNVKHVEHRSRVAPMGLTPWVSSLEANSCTIHTVNVFCTIKVVHLCCFILLSFRMITKCRLRRNPDCPTHQF
jgi:hypothetical protein